MYLFETCAYKVISETGELTCLDTGIVECFRRHHDVIRDFCRKDFRECPYYRIHGAGPGSGRRGSNTYRGPGGESGALSRNEVMAAPGARPGPAPA